MTLLFTIGTVTTFEVSLEINIMFIVYVYKSESKTSRYNVLYLFEDKKLRVILLF